MKSHQKPMQTVWRSLLWKEWQEQKWKLWVLVPLVFVLPMVFLLVDGLTVRWIEVIGFSIIPFGILAGLFMGMGTAAAEQQRGTIGFLQSLPVAMREPGSVKLGVSCLIVAIPIFLVLIPIYAS